MVRFTAAAVLAFAVSAMAISSDGQPVDAAAPSTQDEAQPPKEANPEDFKKWMLTVAEAAEELRKVAEEVAKNPGANASSGNEAEAEGA
ncbi:hypothetical protein LLEC1_03891 [Akanthomyces lecanii]|uniref:PH domain-containing protein n=1 Tax=Cordyceps confragosa TaxID=2714763 RepID=A0A179II85_CORDF|nr:hypothetical protein LLEC1_03891 [Akanthomyces lecanii]